MSVLRVFVFSILLLIVDIFPVFAAEVETLKIRTKNGAVHEFQVEVARTNRDRQQGLMYRQSLETHSGMLFEFSPPQIVHMWMKNTYIALDMLFIRSDGTIAKIAERTEPLSERTISSGENVLAVLEIKGGTAQLLGISPDDQVEHDFFKKN